jgi:REP element-mobilizing transposase RayT
MPLDYKLFYERQLPHYQLPGAVLFVTFRLAGSIPVAVLRELAAEADRVEAMLLNMKDPDDRQVQAYLEQRRLFGKWDEALHIVRSGPTWLRQPEIAQVVTDALILRDGEVYELHAYCIMPNHVHLVFMPLAKPDGTYHALSSIMHSLKRYTAQQANLLLERHGEFWQHESYDHVVRDEAERVRIVRYVLQNPEKAELVAPGERWPWSYSKDLQEK